MMRHSAKLELVKWGFGVLALVLGLLMSASAAFAGTGGGAGGSSDGGTGTAEDDDTCLSLVEKDTKKYGSGTITQWDHCGAGFQLYDVNNSGAWPRKQTDYINENVVPVCSNFGGKFYYLSLHRVKLNSAGNGVDYVGGFSHRRQVKQLTSGSTGGNGSIPYYAKPDALPFAEVLKNHEMAVEFANNQPPEIKKLFESLLNTPWSETSWFCWNAEWAGTKSGFQSKSLVTGDGKTNTSADWDKDAEELAVKADDEGKATIVFSHQLRYEAGQTEGEYENASTDWKIVTDSLSNDVTGNWSTPGKTAAESDWLPKNQTITVNVTLGEGETEKRVCSKISYKTKTMTWSSDNPHKMQPNNDDGSTQACAKIMKEAPTPKAKGHFYAESTIEVPQQDNGYVKAATSTSEKDGMKESDEEPGGAGWVEFSTDQEDTKLKFYHYLTYVNEFQFAENDVVPKPQTDWKIEENTDLHGAFSVDGKKGGKSEKLAEEDVTVKLNKGETKTVCRTIYYKPKYIEMTVKDGGDHDAVDKTHETGHLYYEYEILDSGKTGEGRSQACARITRPNDPQGSPWSGAESGNAASGPMFAGEETSIGWNVSAESWATRRLVYYQSINFMLPTSRQYSAVAMTLKGNLANRTDVSPCSYYGGLGISNCIEMGEDSTALSYGESYGEHTYDSESLIAVPNEVGYKHCNSAGYHHERWRRVCEQVDGKRTCHWEYVSSYWTYYGAACRTIAKKPSVAFWNGGVMTSGMITGVMANRFDTDNLFGNYAAEAGSRKLYGSWTEDLAVAFGDIKRFGSGSALAQGIPGGEEADAKEYSSLTITNNNLDVLGNSGIKSTSSLRRRLETYLRGNDTGEMPGYGVRVGVNDLYNGWTGTKMVVVPGDLRVTKSICMDGANADGTCRSTRTFSNIYELPQAIIFVDGNVEIAPEVREVNAWIVARGELNTCKEFQNNATETGTKDASYSGNVPCEKQLQFNGPVWAGSLKLNRTHGADPSTGSAKYEPAEIFNLSTETYLWAYAQAGRYKSSYTEASTRELPPRY